MANKSPDVKEQIQKLESDMFNISLVFSLAVISIGATYLLKDISPGGIIICAIGLAWPALVEWTKNTSRVKSMGVDEAYAWSLKNLLTYDKAVTAVVGIIAITRIVGLLNK